MARARRSAARSQTVANSMQEAVIQKIQNFSASQTKSERAVAAYLLSHLRSIPFETGSSIARKVGVSGMTVSRVLRSMGFDGLAGLKSELSRNLEPAWLIGDRYARIASGGGDGSRLARSLELEIQAIVSAYEHAERAGWVEATRLLSRTRNVFVTGFQTVQGVARDFAARLEYIRDGVRFIDGANGTYAEVFTSAPGDSCLVIVDIRRYSRQTRLIARKAREVGLPTIFVVDSACYWAGDYGELVFHVPTDVDLFWDSNASITSLLNLLLQDTIYRLGDRVGARIALIQGLQEEFEAFED